LQLLHLLLLDAIAVVAQVIPPIATHFSIVWSVRHLSSVCLSVTFVAPA